MTEPRTLGGKVARYAGWAGLVVAGFVLVGWPFGGAAVRRALLLAGGVAWVVQLGCFGALQTVSPGTSHFLGVWIGGTVIRFSVVAAVGFAIAEVESIDLVVALLGMAGLLLVLMFVELWVILADQRRP